MTTTEIIVGLLSLLVTGVISGLFGLIWRLFARLGSVEKRLDRAEQAIYEEQVKVNYLSLSYETVRLLAVEIARILREYCVRDGDTVPAAVALVESKPPVEKVISDAADHARADMARRREGHGH